MINEFIYIISKTIVITPVCHSHWIASHIVDEALNPNFVTEPQF